MRRSLVVLCVLILGGSIAMSAQPGHTSRMDRVSHNPLMLLGDLDGNGVQSIDDVAMLLSFVDGLETPDAWQIRAGDLDLDGALTQNDARQLLEMVDADGDHFAVRVSIEVEPSGKIVTTSTDLLARLHGEEKAALTNAQLTQISARCTDCGGACVDGVTTRTIETTFSFLDPTSADAGISNPTQPGNFTAANEVFNNCSPVSNFTGGPTPTCNGDTVFRNRTVRLTTCAIFGVHYDVTGVFRHHLPGCP